MNTFEERKSILSKYYLRDLKILISKKRYSDGNGNSKNSIFKEFKFEDICKYKASTCMLHF